MFFIFPFEMIEKGSNIVIYGAGRAGQDYIAQVEKTKYCNVICLLDRNYKTVQIEGNCPVRSPDDIGVITGYDYLLISVQLKNIAGQIKEFLLSNGVPEEKILWSANRHFAFPNELSGLKEDVTINSPSGGKDSDAYKEYVEYVEGLNYILRNKSANRYFVEITEKPYERHEDDVKLIAWYLPQFYKMEVNDKHHGLGFTEWTNTTRTIPLFTGHYQPRLPYDTGFYNLTDIDTLKRQVELAKMYGIHGFAFHYYWFSGVKTMEKPIELFLEHKELDIKFCMHWCTENWTALWDGEDNALIFEQKLEDGDDERFMRDILPYMKDERYIRIDGKPVLIIYRINIFEKSRFKKLIERFRQYAKDSGFLDLYVMITTRDRFSGELDEWGVDAIAEIPSSSIVERGNDRYRIKGHINRYFYEKNNVFDVESYIDLDCPLPRQYDEEKIYRSALVGFDSSPRKANTKNCWLTINSTPQNYKKWLKNIIKRTKTARCNEENYAFVFAWNEWAESAYLEPDMLYGYAYLQATKEALEETRPIRDDVVIKELECKKSRGITDICFYIHCVEHIGDIVACEPIARYLKSVEPNSKLIWIVKENAVEVVRWNPYIDEVIEVKCLTQSINIIRDKRLEPSNIIVDCHYNGRKCDSSDEININPNNPQIGEYSYLDYGSLLTSFCYTAGIRTLSDAPVFYQNPDVSVPENLPEKYVVFHCKSGEHSKDWVSDKWKALAERIIDAGFNVVEIGLEPLAAVESGSYYDYTGVKSIQTAAEIIKHSVCFIGVDSLFAHVANCLGVYGILLFGKYRGCCRPMFYTGGYAAGLKSSIIYAKDNLPADAISHYDVFWEFKNAQKRGFD